REVVSGPFPRRRPEFGRASGFMAARGCKPKPAFLAIGGPAMSYGRVTPGSGLRAGPLCPQSASSSGYLG
ncbi:MAG TPA: hypothetical protein VN203_06120, partial [Candidatus Acidoferrum sp.]|nr:hypothetical protein [Candidatus Acidoferrum sp.]